jgi:hypothetical protein
MDFSAAWILLSALTDGRSPTDGERPTCKELAIQHPDGLFRHCIFFEFDESKSSRPAGCVIVNNLDGACLETLGAEPLGQCIFCFCERNVTNKQSLQNSPPTITNLNMTTRGECGIVHCPTRSDRGF